MRETTQTSHMGGGGSKFQQTGRFWARLCAKFRL
jgi:hypothetical protein